MTALGALTLLGLAIHGPPDPPHGERPTRAAADQVRVTARTVVVDREALSRVGLDYVVLDHGRVRVRTTAAGRGGGARLAVGLHGVTAFLEAVRENRWVRSESTQQVLVRSGAQAMVSSSRLTAGTWASRTQGPSLVVTPLVQPDGTVRLRVSARLEDVVRGPWGHTVDGSPAAVETEVVARDGEEVLVASSSSVETGGETRLLGWSAGERGRDVLVAVTARVFSP